MQVQLALGGVVHGRTSVADRVAIVLRLLQLLPPPSAIEGDLQTQSNQAQHPLSCKERCRVHLQILMDVLHSTSLSITSTNAREQSGPL